MDLKQIRLEKIVDKKYRELAENWGVKPRSVNRQRFWARITKSFYCQSYGTLIEDFTKTPWAYQIAVRGQGPNWEKKFIRTDQNPVLRDKEIESLSSLARSNPYKRGYFELKFLKHPGNDEKRLLILSFGEIDGKVILTDINIPKFYENFFDVSNHLKNISYYYLNGMLDYSPKLVEIR